MGVLCLWKLTLALPQKDKSSSEDFIPTFEEAVPSGMMLNDTVDLSELGDTKDKRKEYIRTLKFLPGDEQLAVGTNERLMILNVPKVINSLNISTTIDNIAKSLGEHDGNMSGSRKMDFDARREGFKIASEEVVTITPRVGFVIKSRRGNGQKVSFAQDSNQHAKYSVFRCRFSSISRIMRVCLNAFHPVLFLIISRLEHLKAKWKRGLQMILPTARNRHHHFCPLHHSVKFYLWPAL